MVKDVASQSPEVKKLVYLYLLHHAGKQAASFLPVISGARSEYRVCIVLKINHMF